MGLAPPKPPMVIQEVEVSDQEMRVIANFLDLFNSGNEETVREYLSSIFYDAISGSLVENLFEFVDGFAMRALDNPDHLVLVFDFKVFQERLRRNVVLSLEQMEVLRVPAACQIHAWVALKLRETCEDALKLVYEHAVRDGVSVGEKTTGKDVDRLRYTRSVKVDGEEA